MSEQERDLIIRSMIASMALSGIDVPRDMAERIFDEVEREPLIDLDGGETQ